MKMVLSVQTFYCNYEIKVSEVRNLITNGAKRTNWQMKTPYWWGQKRKLTIVKEYCLLSCICRPLCCLIFDLRSLIFPAASSNFLSRCLKQNMRYKWVLRIVHRLLDWHKKIKEWCKDYMLLGMIIIHNKNNSESQMKLYFLCNVQFVCMLGEWVMKLSNAKFILIL